MSTVENRLKIAFSSLSPEEKKPLKEKNFGHY